MPILLKDRPLNQRMQELGPYQNKKLFYYIKFGNNFILKGNIFNLMRQVVIKSLKSIIVLLTMSI